MSDANEPRQLVPAELEDLSGNAGGSTSDWTQEPGPAATSSVPMHEFEAVYDVPVKVHAVLGRSRMEIGELMRLRAGDVVELDRRVGEPVDLFVSNRLIARGEVVLIDNALGVTLTEIVRQDR